MPSTIANAERTRSDERFTLYGSAASFEAFEMYALRRTAAVSAWLMDGAWT
jgi:hypothetical protein